MPETRDVQSLMAAAAQAASVNDAAKAVAWLQQALDQQESSLGTHHRELAPTLNNLALMLEREGQIPEAERCYRRAYEIARHGAASNDPLVQVSRENLAAFLRAIGRVAPGESVPWGDLEDFPPDADSVATVAEAAPASRPIADEFPKAVASPPNVPAPPALISPPAAATRPAPPAPPIRPSDVRAIPRAPITTRPRVDTPAPPPRHGARRPTPLLPWAAAALVLFGVVAAWMWRAPGSPPDEPRVASAPAPEAQPAPAPPAAVPSPAPAPPAADPKAAPPPPSTSANAARADSTTARPKTPAASATVTAEASLCRALIRSSAAWRCDPPADPVAGPVYYYTRVKSARDVTMQHRWTRDGRVVRTIDLPVRANAQFGFRTFSRQVVSGAASGQWEVALIAPGGAVVDTRRFTVPARRD